MFSSHHPTAVHRALTVLTSRGPWRAVLWQLLCGCLLMSVSCSSVWVGTHNGVRFTVHQDHRWSRIDNGKGQFTYDSPELTVTAENGRLVINNEDAGELNPGDHVQITDLGTVLVNGQRRGDAFTGEEALKERLARREEMLSKLRNSGANEKPAAADEKTPDTQPIAEQPVKQASADDQPTESGELETNPFANRAGRSTLK